MKTDFLHKILKVIDHERGKIFAFVLSILIVFGLSSCDIKLTSPLTGRKVTQEQFNIEVVSAKAKIEAVIKQAENDMKALLSNAEITQAEFEKWQEVKNKIFDISAGVITTMTSGGTIDTGQIIASIIGLGGILTTAGGLYDSNRKNKKIEEEKAKNKTQ